ncbi:phage head-binding domain-containing protein [Pantoea sp. SIMBA_079]|uniref:phage head-binding domain-containing protein n=1 Tax=Pantoea sp. SIMBA_079 TaxID=3085817 RepID=UPI003992737C
MADVTANVVVSMPSQLFTASRSFKALANGRIYIGKIDTDPTLPTNQVQAYLQNESGDLTPLPQPIVINAAGFPVFNGQVAKIVTAEGHSMAVYDAYGSLEHYFPSVLKYDPDLLRKDLNLPSGAGLIGFDAAQPYPSGTIGSAIKNNRKIGVSPEEYGGDIQAAANAAVELSLPLISGRKDYEVQNALTLPSGLTWISAGTRIKMMRAGSGGTNPLDSGIVPQNNTRIIGRVYIYLVDSPGAAAFRAHLLLGNWTTGAGVNNFTFDELVLEGGHSNINGVAIAGDSYNIRGNRIDAGTSTVIGRALMTHWGNFAEHYLSGGTYRHASGAGPTTHPHDIHVKEVVGNLTASIGDFMALVGISAGYDTTVDRIAGSVINNGAGTAQLLLLTGGDMGLAYAPSDIRAAGMRNLVFGTVEGSTNKIGISRIGRALYWDKDSTPQTVENYYVKISETVANANLKSTSNNTIHQAIGGSNFGGRCCYGNVVTDGFVNSFSPGNYDTGGIIDLLVSNNNQFNAVLYAGAGADSTIYPTGMRINKLVINGTGAQGAEALNYHGVRTQSCVGLFIGSLDAISLHPIGYAVLFNTLSTGVYIDAIKVFPAYNRGAAALNQMTTPTDCNVGQVYGTDPLTAISGGITYKPFGRFREFQYPAANSLPIGVNVVVGDRFVATSGSTGQAALSVITGAGTTGSGATAKTLLTF